MINSCMGPVNFFDRIEGAGRSADAADDYFYLHAISGKLGAKTLTRIDANSLKEKLLDQPQTRKQAFLRVVLDIIKFLSYFTVVIPLIFLTMKACARAKHKYTIAPKAPENVPLPLPIVPKPEAIAAANKYLASLFEEKKSLDSSFATAKGNYAYFFIVLADDLRQAASWQSSITADQNLANLPTHFENDPDAYFIPSTIAPEQENQFDKLKQSLESAFLVGKKIVVTRLSNSIHGVAVAFQSDGKFRIVDSMSGTTVDVAKLTEKLNAAGIKGQNGEIIHFQGDYINTEVQRGGNECARFSGLYAYQMAKRRSLEAYKEVNGAFLEGRLKRFEDYRNIDGSRQVESLSSANVDYKPFMTSWAYRTQNYPKDDLKEIPVADLNFMNWRDTDKVGMYILRKRQLPRFILTVSNQKSHGLVLNNGKEPEKNIKDVKDLPFAKIPIKEGMKLGELLPQDDDHAHLYFGQYKGNQLELYAYRVNQVELDQLSRCLYHKGQLREKELFRDLQG